MRKKITFKNVVAKPDNMLNYEQISSFIEQIINDLAIVNFADDGEHDFPFSVSQTHWRVGRHSASRQIAIPIAISPGFMPYK